MVSENASKISPMPCSCYNKPPEKNCPLEVWATLNSEGGHPIQ